jgi:cytochrome c
MRNLTGLAAAVVSSAALIAGLTAPGMARAECNKEVAAAALKPCAKCHKLRADEPEKDGPTLLPSPYGKKAGTVDPTFPYTTGLKATGWTWDEPTLLKWLEKPQDAVRETLMLHSGTPDPAKRQAIVCVFKERAGK